MMTFEDAEKIFATARYPDCGKPLAKHTRLYRIDSKYGAEYLICFWYTNILTIRSNGVYILNSGGHRTKTTKSRLNEYSPVFIFQENRLWYVNLCGYVPVRNDSQVIPFEDYMTVYA